MERVSLGHVAVDSGQLMIVDPFESMFISSLKISIFGNIFSISLILFKEGWFFLLTLVVIIGLPNSVTILIGNECFGILIPI